ncbi:MAG: PhoU domain-containing protein, partial [Bdellovibrionota bacterium]
DVANAHLLFNLLGALLFYPFVGYGVRQLEKWIQPRENERDFSVKYLDRVNFESPAICIAHAEREIMRMGDIVLSMLKDSITVLRDDNPDLIKEMRARDNKVDLLNREISLFITKYMESAESGMHKQMIRLFSVAADLESAADVIDNSMLELAGKKHKLKVEFSDEGWKEIETMHNAVTEVAMMSLSCFQVQSRDLAEKVIQSKRDIRKLEKVMRESHISRLVKGRSDSINTSSIHMDVLSDYRRIVGLFSNHVYHLAKPDSEKFVITKRGGM